MRIVDRATAALTEQWIPDRWVERIILVNNAFAATLALALLILLLVCAAMTAARAEDRQCWYSSGWHGSGYYDCRLGPWQRDESGTVVVPRDRREDRR